MGFFRDIKELAALKEEYDTVKKEYGKKIKNVLLKTIFGDKYGESRKRNS